MLVWRQCGGKGILASGFRRTLDEDEMLIDFGSMHRESASEVELLRTTF